jgi:hypothetical protein
MSASIDDGSWTITAAGGNFPFGVAPDTGSPVYPGRANYAITVDFATNGPLAFQITQDMNATTSLHDTFKLTIQNNTATAWAGFRIDYVDFVAPAPDNTSVHPQFAHFHDFTDNGSWPDPLAQPFQRAVGYNTTTNSLQPTHGTESGVNGANELRLSGGLFAAGTQQVWQGINVHQFLSSASGGGSFSVVLTPVLSADPVGAVAITATGDIDSNGRPDSVWSDSNGFLSMWSYDPAGQTVSTIGVAAAPGWAVLGGSHWSNASTDQMLMDYVPTGTMTLWWVNNGQLTGINLGQRWADVAYVGAGQFTSNGGTNLLVTNIHDHHLYDWWVNPDNTLGGIDLTNTAGPAWNNVGIVATGQFTANGGTNFLVQNGLDRHLYDWWIGSNSVLTGIDLGPVWSNVALVGTGQFTANGGTNFLVTNTLDHHVYDWWIAANGALTGIDLGPYWFNVQLVTVGHFDNGTSNTELLVQNTVDHHLYEWWITPQGQLTGIDFGPYWINVQTVGAPSHYNNNSPYDQLLIHNTSDGNFYQWWIAGNQLQGTNLGPSLNPALSAGGGFAADGAAPTDGASLSVPPMSAGPISAAALTVAPSSASVSPELPQPSALSDSTSLLVQSMASFGASDAVGTATGTLLTAGVGQLSDMAAPIDQRMAHR